MEELVSPRGRGYGPAGPPRFRGPPPPNWIRGRGGRFPGPGWREDWERPNWGPMGPPPPNFSGPPGMMGPPGMVCINTYSPVVPISGLHSHKLKSTLLAELNHLWSDTNSS